MELGERRFTDGNAEDAECLACHAIQALYLDGQGLDNDDQVLSMFLCSMNALKRRCSGMFDYFSVHLASL